MADRPQKTPQSSDTPSGMSLRPAQPGIRCYARRSRRFHGPVGRRRRSGTCLPTTNRAHSSTPAKCRPLPPPSQPTTNRSPSIRAPFSKRCSSSAAPTTPRSPANNSPASCVASLPLKSTLLSPSSTLNMLLTAALHHRLPRCWLPPTALPRIGRAPRTDARPPPPARLSPAAVEVLAVIAYNEPLSTTEVNKIRGTSSGHILRHLIRRRLSCAPKARRQIRPSQILHHASILRGVPSDEPHRFATQRRPLAPIKADDPARN